jgi:hypothetical protein
MCDSARRLPRAERAKFYCGILRVCREATVQASMSDDDIRKAVAALSSKSVAAEEAAWAQLRELGEQVLPFFEEVFASTKRLEGRRSIAFHSMRYARKSDIAFRIGLAAIEDRSSVVRYRGCCILAYSLRADALPHLKKLLAHSDNKTREDATAAIDAIEHGNHHLFVDRSHSGQSFWEVNPGDIQR